MLYLDRKVQGKLWGRAPSFGADVRIGIVGGLETAVGGDRSEVTTGKWEHAARLDVLIKSTVGDLLIESVTSTAELKAALEASLNGGTKGTVLGPAIDLGSGAANALVLGGAG